MRHSAPVRDADAATFDFTFATRVAFRARRRDGKPDPAGHGAFERPSLFNTTVTARRPVGCKGQEPVDARVDRGPPFRSQTPYKGQPSNSTSSCPRTPPWTSVSFWRELIAGVRIPALGGASWRPGTSRCLLSGTHHLRQPWPRCRGAAPPGVRGSLDLDLPAPWARAYCPVKLVRHATSAHQLAHGRQYRYPMKWDLRRDRPSGATPGRRYASSDIVPDFRRHVEPSASHAGA
jgi:hypothetical protein